jgi:hypothetical protein
MNHQPVEHAPFPPAERSTSTGPRTPEGKSRSRFNAFKHGLTGQILFMTPDEQAGYDQHCQGFFDVYKPVGLPERVLVQSLADNYWRLQRGQAFENALFSLDLSPRRQHDQLSDCGIPPLEPVLRIEARSAAARALTWLDNQDSLLNLTLYVQRIERSIAKTNAALETLQTKRKAAEHQAQEEAKALARVEYADGNPYDPQRDFPAGGEFVFSNRQIHDLVVREDRLKVARLWQEAGFNPGYKPKPPYTVPTSVSEPPPAR